VSTRAVTTLLLSAIGKKDMNNILENFSDHREYLTLVAQQRLQTTYKGDMDMYYTFPWENLDEQENDPESPTNA
jgi:hypothetical protein